ncbi:MAG: hypothetical protein Q4B43_10875, partial [Bacteroidota bacterium]|nr:hypothetical protein [Bacteroidota bacterium]
MKQTIPDKEILKRLQRSEICLYLIPLFLLIISAIGIFLSYTYESEQDWYPFYEDPHGTSVYAHGEVFTDVWGSGTPQIVELFSDYGWDYRKF